jgi:glycosyltransferase involved in cell wall biosynthesis
VSRRYALIAPCRDEAAFLRRTLDAIERQTVTPALCVVVDDGSTDATPQILAEYAARLPWLRIVTRANRGKRAVGPGVIEAFYAGLETVDLDAFDYLCKIDLDLDLPSRYFETLIERMEAEPRLGTFSGKPWVELEGRLVPEPAGDEMSVGMTKFYRTACFRQIGGFVREVMWDGIDCHRARLLGWLAGSSDTVPDLRLIHLRPMGSSQKGIHTGRQRHGFGQWFMGTGPLYMAASSVFRMSHPPYLTGGLSMFWGYVKAARAGAPRYADGRFRRFLNRYQRLMLTRGKSAATQAIGDEQAWAWDPQREAAPMGAAPPPEFPRYLPLPRATHGVLSVHALDARAAAATIGAQMSQGQGGWLQVLSASRYEQDPAYAQLVQDASLGLVSADGLVEALAGLGQRTLRLVHGSGAKGATSLPLWSWNQGEAALGRARDALADKAPSLVVAELDSPQQEWLVSRLRREFPATWFVALGSTR